MAYAELRHTETSVHIEIETTWNEKELIKTIPGVRWNVEDKVWSVPLGWTQCIILRGVFGQQITFGAELTKWGWCELETRINPAMKLRMQTSLSDDTDERLREVIESWR